jgi:hypothetical protein
MKMKTRKIELIVVLLVAMTTTAGLVQVAYADAAGDKDAAKRTFETIKHRVQFDLANVKRQSWDLLAGSAQPITQKKEYRLQFDPADLKKQSWALLADSVQPTTKSAQGESLAERATDPTSPLIQFRIENSFIPESFDSSGYANTAQIQPVIPWKAPWGQLMITRLTIPFPLIADPDGPVNETSGLGDIDLLHLFICKKDWGATGLGFNMSFPTATDVRLGSDKYQAGPAGVLVYKGIPKWQLGGLVYNNWSYATNRGGKENVNKMFIQWIATYHFKPGWYMGWGDLPMTFNWRNGKQNIPLSVRLGHTMKIGKQDVDMFVQPFYTASHEGASGEYGVKFALTFLFPE